MMYRILVMLFKRNPLLHGANSLKVLLLFICLVWYATSGYLYFELPAKPDLRWSDALWWTLVTMTTVGYGDFFPESTAGRYLVGLPTMIFGIGFLGFIISELAAKFIESRSRRLQGMENVKAKNHIIIVNFSKYEDILNLISELKSDPTTQHKHIVIIDEDLQQIPPRLADFGVHFVKGNPTSERILNQANLVRASHVIVLAKDRGNPHSDDQNLATVLIVEKLHPDIFSIVEVVDPEKVRQMELAGGNSVVCVSDFTTNLVIQELQDPGIKQVIEQLTSNRYGQQFYLAPVHGRDVQYRHLLQWGAASGYAVVGLMRRGKALINCAAGENILAEDLAILIGQERPKEVSLSV